MESLSDILKNPVWWVSVVLVSLIINIFSAYIKILLDETFGRFSKNLREKNETRRKALDKYMDFLMENENEVLSLKITVIETLLKTLLVVVIAIFGSSLIYIIIRNFLLGGFLSNLIQTVTYLIFTTTIIFSYNKYSKVNRILKAYNKTFKTPNDWYQEIWSGLSIKANEKK